MELVIQILSKDYSDSIEVLYSVSYSIKFILKKEKDIDYSVMPLEGLWWAGRYGSIQYEKQR